MYCPRAFLNIATLVVVVALLVFCASVLCDTERCSGSGVLTGRIVTPADDDYNSARLDWNRFNEQQGHQSPSMIIFCQHVRDVANAVLYARANGIPFRVRSGRHSYESLSTLARGGLVIDLTDMKDKEIDEISSSGPSIAGFGAGNRLVEVYDFVIRRNFMFPGSA